MEEDQDKNGCNCKPPPLMILDALLRESGGQQGKGHTHPNAARTTQAWPRRHVRDVPFQAGDRSQACGDVRSDLASSV